jgi:serine/threonine protein kinase/tetratricopeptide (TPR) repeat protein
MPADPQRVQSVFLTLAAVPPADRAAALDLACGGDAELRLRVEALLKAHDAPDSLLDEPAVDPAAMQEPTDDERRGASPPAEAVGTLIGPYKLLQTLGEGGMGTVWVAEQQQPVKRRVALKVIKPGLDSALVLRRFEAERQALALMDHSNIARVFDAGATESGRPYFVMELVHGVPITRYCDELNLAIRERLGLFVPVCQAIQHAHQKGIIHRDIKPSNVLVCIQDGRPVPKVIDFGVAKAMNQRLTEATVYTEFGAVVGTLEYMAPEQAEMSPLGVDTRADVYALGVLLYELLTGTTPLDRKRLKQAAFLEVLRIIKEEEPPRPSTRLSASKETLAGVAARRRTEPAKLTKAVRGELDWIALKCLEKDRTRRYESASALARDVERHLADEPVEACPPSRRYRLGKSLRRHKGPVLAAGLVLLALVGGMAGTSCGLLRAERAWQAEAQRAEGERQARVAEAEQRGLAEERKELAEANEKRAVAEKQVAEAVRTFLQRDLLRQADPWQQADALRQRGGDGFQAKENPTIKELLDRAAVGLAPGKIEAKFPGQRELQASILMTVGDTYQGIGEYGKAVAFLVRASDAFREALGADHRDTLAALNNLALAHRNAGQVKQAIELFERTQVAQVKALGADHRDTLATLHNLALAYQGDGQLSRAVELYERARDAQVRTLGADHPDTLTTLHDLARAYRNAGQLPRAIELFERVRDADVKVLGADHPHALITLNNLAWAYTKAGQLPRAIELFERVRDAQVKALGADHPDTLLTLGNLALAYKKAGQLPRAIELFERVRDADVKVLGADHPRTLATLHNLATAYRDARELPRAIELYERVRDAQVKALGADHPDTLLTLASLAGAYMNAGERERGLSLFRQAAEGIDKQKFQHEFAGPIVSDLIACLEQSQQYAEAETWGRRWLAGMKERVGAESPAYTGELAALGVNVLKQKKWADAEPVLRDCLALREKVRPDVWSTFNTRSLLGEALQGQQKYAEAESLLLAGYRGMKEREATIPPPDRKVRLAEALERLMGLYEATGRQDEAARWRKQLYADAERLPPPRVDKP